MNNIFPFRIVVSGPMGAGKTTLIRLWKSFVGCSTYEEPVINNVYLEDLYSDPTRWALEMQLYMLNIRLEAHSSFEDSDHVIEDRCFLEDGVFAKTQAKMGFIDKRSFATYKDHMKMMTRVMDDFDIIVYLDISAKECMRRIKKRNRKCEQGITQEYIDKLCSEYQKWILNISKIIPVFRVNPGQIYVENGKISIIKNKAVLLWAAVINRLTKRVSTIPREITPPPGSPELMPSVPTKIVIVGPLAAGKTTLVENWEKQTGYSIHKEPVSENVYLKDYYNDQERWAFEIQIYLLNKRLEAQMETDKVENTIQDRSYLDDEVFARTQVAMGYMDERALDNYNKYFSNMSQRMRNPHLIIYLSITSKESMDRIKERNRDCELDIPQDYLDELGKQYDEWVERIARTIPVIKVNGEKMRVKEENEQEKRIKIKEKTESLWEKVCEEYKEWDQKTGIVEVEC